MALQLNQWSLAGGNGGDFHVLLAIKGVDQNGVASLSNPEFLETEQNCIRVHLWELP